MSDKILKLGDQMKATIVGYWGGFPAANEATSGYLLEHEGFSLLVDCGSGVLAQLQNYIKIEELDAMILSHFHHDHIADIGPVQYARIISNAIGKKVKELPIYSHTYDEEGFKKLELKGMTTGVAYDPDNILNVGPFAITFLQTKHPAPCYAMRISAGGKTVVYTADSSYFEELAAFAKNADLLIGECNLYAGQDGSQFGHMTSEENGKLANLANVKELWLTHLPHFGNHQELIVQASEQYGGKIQLAKSGLIWE